MKAKTTNNRLRAILSTLMALSMTLSISACSSRSLGEQKPSASPSGTQASEETPSASNQDAPFDDEYYKNMEELMDAREKLKELEGKWYNHTEMSEERQEFRLSCIKDGINLATSGTVENARKESIYNDALRNIYSITGYSITMSGQVDYVQRTGTETVMWIRSNTLNPFTIVARAYDDIPALKDDWITVFGSVSGPENDTVAMTIMDYYFGSTDSIFSDAKSIVYLSKDIDRVFEIGFTDGMPSMFQSEKDFWFGTYQDYGHHFTIIVTEDAVTEEDGTTHPYKVYGYYRDNNTGCYILKIRYTELENYYREDSYTLFCLFYEQLAICSLNGLNDFTEQVNYGMLMNFRLSTSNSGDKLYVMNKV